MVLPGSKPQWRCLQSKERDRLKRRIAEGDKDAEEELKKRRKEGAKYYKELSMRKLVRRKGSAHSTMNASTEPARQQFCAVPNQVSHSRDMGSGHRQTGENSDSPSDRSKSAPQWRRLRTKERNALKQRIAEGDETAYVELEKRRQDECDYVKWCTQKRKEKKVQARISAKQTEGESSVQAPAPESMEEQDKCDHLIAALKEPSDVEDVGEQRSTPCPNAGMYRRNDTGLGDLPVSVEVEGVGTIDLMSPSEYHAFMAGPEMRQELAILAVQLERGQAKEREAWVRQQSSGEIPGNTTRMHGGGA